MYTATHLLLHVCIVVFSSAGFSLAYYIRIKKHGSRPLVCPVGANCESVVRSEYAYFLGIPVELLGMGYYGATLVGYALLLFFPGTMTVESMFLLFIITSVAFLFSLYLTALQAFILREWCTWCLGSTLISAVIFFASIALSRFGLDELLRENAYSITLIQFLALAVGVGATTLTSLFYTKFLADLIVSASESDVLRTIVQVHWIALAMVLLTGVGLYLPQASQREDFESPVVVALLVATCLTIISFVLYYIVAPKLVLARPELDIKHAVAEMRRLRRRVLAFSGLSLVSWYFVFVLRSLAPEGVMVGTLLLVYVAGLTASVILALIYEQLQPR